MMTAAARPPRPVLLIDGPEAGTIISVAPHVWHVALGSVSRHDPLRIVRQAIYGGAPRRSVYVAASAATWADCDRDPSGIDRLLAEHADALPLVSRITLDPHCPQWLA